MPDGTPAPVPGQQPQQPQAPFGQTSAVSPTPNRGHEAAAAQGLGLVVQKLAELVPMSASNKDLMDAILDSLKKLSKFVPAGSVTPAAQKNQLEQMAMKQGQNNQQMQQLAAMRAQGQGGGAQPGQAKAA